MRVVLTGGAGDLGKTIYPLLMKRGDVPAVLDVRQPQFPVEFIHASITDREALRRGFAGSDIVVHIAAWHGVHEFRKERDVYEFWDLNVTGTFNVFQSAIESGVNNVLFISSTSIDDPHSIYGHTKVLGEEIARTYAIRHGMNVITLRPRAFIPHWNRTVYTSYIDWAKWFWTGAVHIDDLAQAVVSSVDLLSSNAKLDQPLFLTVDGAYEYSELDLENWDQDGPETTFKRYYSEFYKLALQHGLDPSLKPRKLDITETRKRLNYSPQFSLKSLLQELARYGAAGPPVEHD